MKGINFNQSPTHLASGSSRATCENSTERMWKLVVTVPVPSGFSDLMVLGVCNEFLCPLQSLCHALSSGVNNNTTARMAASPSPSLAGSQTRVSITTRGRRLTFERQPLLPHSMGREQGWGHLGANLGFGIFWFIPFSWW